MSSRCRLMRGSFWSACSGRTSIAWPGVPPSIAIEQRNGVRNARSTVGTVTEISDYLRLLFARIGEIHCPTCDTLAARDTAQAAADRVLRARPTASASTSWRARRSACPSSCATAITACSSTAKWSSSRATRRRRRARCRSCSIVSRSRSKIGRAWPTRSTRPSRSAAAAPKCTSKPAPRSSSTKASAAVECGTTLRAPEPALVLVQLAARRLRGVPRLRPRHRHRPRQGHPRRPQDARRRRDRALSDQVEPRVPSRSGQARARAQSAARRAVAGAVEARAEVGARRRSRLQGGAMARRQVVRRARAVALSRVQEVQDACARVVGALSRLR